MSFRLEYQASTISKYLMEGLCGSYNSISVEHFYIDYPNVYSHCSKAGLYVTKFQDGRPCIDCLATLAEAAYESESRV